MDGNNTNTITVDYSLTAVSGDITVNAVNSCGTSITSTLAVIVNPIPENPVISLNGYILSSDAPSGNQWYFEGSTIPGATGQTYDASLTGSGWYWSVVTMNGCTSDTSNHIYVLITGMGEVSSTPFSIFPVPNDGRFTFTMSTQSLQVVRLYVFNNLGARVYESPNMDVNGTIVKVIDLRPVPSGLYTVVIETPAGKMMRKIIVNR